MAYQGTWINPYRMSGVCFMTILLIDDAGIMETVRREIKFRKLCTQVSAADRNTAFTDLRTAYLAERAARAARILADARQSLYQSRVEVDRIKSYVVASGGSPNE